MVLAVIVGIGSNFFTEFTGALQGQEPDIRQAMSLMLASLTIFGLGIFGPSIASGLVAGAHQLGAGAALGTTVGAAGIRSEEHTSELQSLMRNTYAVFCMQKNKYN